jgi:hypothetical protein
VFLLSIIVCIQKVVSKILSYHYFTEVYTIVSIILVILSILVAVIDYYPNYISFKENYLLLNIVSNFLFISLFFNLIFSTFALLDQTQRLEILIYPVVLQFDDFNNYYGISKVQGDGEGSIKVLFLKKGSTKIELNTISLNFPKFGELLLFQTSFLDDNSKYSKSGINTLTPNEIIKIDRQIGGLAANFYYFRIYDKKYYKGTSEKLTVTITYTIFLFNLKILQIEKSATAKIGLTP